MPSFRRPLFSPRYSRAFGLTETLLVLGAVSIMSMAVYAIFFSSDVAAEVKVEQNNLNTLSTAIDRSFGLTGGFGGVSMGELLDENLVPTAYSKSGSLSTEWGGSVLVRPQAVGRANDSFVIEYSAVPADACVRLAAAMAPTVYDLRVGGNSVMGAGGFSPAAAAESCAGPSASRMEFVYYSGLVSGSAVATPGLTLPTAPPSITPANPTTPTGPVGGAPSVGDATPGAPVVLPPAVAPVLPPAAPVAPPAPVAPTVTPPGIPSSVGTPPPSLARCVAPVPTVGTQQVGCAAGQYGMTQQQRTGTYACPEAWASPTFVWGAWGTTSSSCTNCPGSGQEATAQWVGVSAGCPAGQVGSNSWEKEQRATRNYSYNCPAGTPSLPAPSFGGWSAWQDTGATRNQVNTCHSSTTWSWEAVDVAYGPGSGCHLGADQDRADQDAAAGILIKTGTRPYASYSVNEASYPCNEGALGSVIQVYGSCGGWQAGIEGWSGYQCRPQGAYYVWNSSGGESYGAEVYRGPNPSSSPYFAQATTGTQSPAGSCTAGNVGQSATVNTYGVAWWGVGAGRYATIRVLTLNYQCGSWQPDF